MRTLSFTISGQHIEGTPISDLVGNSKNYVEASFSFSSEWDGMTLKVAVFVSNSKEYPVILDAEGKAKVPDICLATDKFTVGIIGAAAGTRLTTDTAEIRVEESVRTKPPYDMISMYTEILDNIEELTDAVDLKQPITLGTPIVISETTYTTVEDVLQALSSTEAQYDDALDPTSTNAVQNLVVKAALDTKQGKDLDNPITIGGVVQTTVEAALAALNTKTIDVDSSLDPTSTNPVQNKVIKAVTDNLYNIKQGKELDSAITLDAVQYTILETLLAAIVNKLSNQSTIDTALDPTSEHAVQNKTIKAALDLKQAIDLTTPVTIDGTQYTTVETAIGAVTSKIIAHLSEYINSSNGAHGFRRNTSGDLQYYDTETDAWITISSGGGGGSITVDTAMSASSTNPVQNRVIYNAIQALQAKTLTNPITIGQTSYNTVEAALAGLVSAIITVDSSLSDSSTNPVENRAVKAALDTHATLPVAGASGVHGFRYYSSKLQVWDTLNQTWTDVTAGSGADVENRLDDIDQNILALALAFSVLQSAAAEGLSDNIVVEVFDDTSGYIIVKGVYDQTNHRLIA